MDIISVRYIIVIRSSTWHSNKDRWICVSIHILHKHWSSSSNSVCQQKYSDICGYHHYHVRLLIIFVSYWELRDPMSQWQTIHYCRSDKKICEYHIFHMLQASEPTSWQISSDQQQIPHTRTVWQPSLTLLQLSQQVSEWREGIHKAGLWSWCPW